MKQTDNLHMPKHIAVIMDGNRRWARNRGLPASFGHEAGAKVAKEFIQNCFDLDISYLTLFVFSSENWRRSSSEIDTLNKLLKLYLKNDLNEIVEQDVKVNIIGEVERFDFEIQSLLKSLQEKSSKCNKFTLNLALNYGGRADICSAVKKIAKEIINNKISLDQIDESVISKNLMTSGIPEPDLFIRTSGESRISNFLIWQLAYTELYFSNKLWPDFTKEDLHEAIVEFSNRDRRYGG